MQLIKKKKTLITWCSVTKISRFLRSSKKRRKESLKDHLDSKRLHFQRHPWDLPKKLIQQLWKKSNLCMMFTRVMVAMQILQKNQEEITPVRAIVQWSVISELEQKKRVATSKRERLDQAGSTLPSQFSPELSQKKTKVSSRPMATILMTSRTTTSQKWTLLLLPKKEKIPV